jgi:hypothetical protein
LPAACRFDVHQEFDAQPDTCMHRGWEIPWLEAGAKPTLPVLGDVAEPLSM